MTESGGPPPAPAAGAVRFLGLVALAVGVYYALLFGLGALARTVPVLGPAVGASLGSGAKPPRMVLLLPLLMVGATGFCMALECWAGGWENSTLKGAIEARSPSVRMDLFYFLLRVSGLLELAAVLFSFGTLNLTTSWLERSLGFHLLDRVGFWPLALAILFLVNSFVFYAFHFLMHSRWLWEIHKVHHSAEDYNLLLPYRNHPVDHWLQAVAYSFFGAVLGGSAGLVLAWLALNSVYQSMVHSKVDWPWPWAEWLLITPAAHRVHHSAAPEHFDRNFGSIVFWDRLFGTYHAPARVARIGLEEPGKFNQDRFAAELFVVLERWGKSL